MENRFFLCKKHVGISTPRRVQDEPTCLQVDGYNPESPRWGEVGPLGEVGAVGVGVDEVGWMKHPKLNSEFAPEKWWSEGRKTI